MILARQDKQAQSQHQEYGNGIQKKDQPGCPHKHALWVVEKKSQYLQRLLQNGICIYIPAKGIYDLTVDHLLFLFIAPKVLHPFCHFLLLWTALGMPKLGTLQSIGHKLLFDKVIGKIMGIEVV